MCKVYAYCRISTPKQSIQRQIDNVRKSYPDAIIVTEEYSGTTLDRPTWNRLYKQLKSGDTCVFDEVSRMARNSAEGFEVYQELFNRGVELVFLKEPHISTSTYREAQNNSIPMTGNEIADIYIEATNKVLMILAKRQIELAFDTAQAEVDFLHQRTREGIEQARLKGKQIGRAEGTKIETKKAKEVKAIIRKHSKDFFGTLSDVDVIKLAGCARNSYYKYKRELLESTKHITVNYATQSTQKSKRTTFTLVQEEKKPEEPKRFVLNKPENVTGSVEVETIRSGNEEGFILVQSEVSAKPTGIMTPNEGKTVWSYSSKRKEEND